MDVAFAVEEDGVHDLALGGESLEEIGVARIRFFHVDVLRLRKQQCDMIFVSVFL